MLASIDFNENGPSSSDFKVSCFSASYFLFFLLLLPILTANFSAYLVFGSQMRKDSIDLNEDQSLLVDITDALSEKEKVKFTVHTKVSTN